MLIRSLIYSLGVMLAAAFVIGWSCGSFAAPSQVNLQVPDTPLVDQDGRAVRFKSDVLGEKTVAISFIYTTCGSICPVIGATFSRLQKLLGDRLGKDVSLVSISIDPTTDTPARLKQWGKQFSAGPGWTLLTGEKGEIQGLLKALEATNHNAPMVLLGKPSTGEWVAAYDDITAPDKLYARLVDLAAKPKADLPKEEKPSWEQSSIEKPSPAQKYFGDTVLTDQNGEKLKLYEDLMKEKVVVVNAFFSNCQGVCSVLLPKLAELQGVAGDHLGKDVSFLSISVDPLNDTPGKLKTFAKGLRSKPGWYFLTGDRDTVVQALRKFGLDVEAREDHSNLLIMGNLRTGLWKKVLGLAKTEDLAVSFRSVLNDEGDTPR